ncbi:zinc finger CCCH domain-containing protein 65-like isoform X3 [Magnolia sinica]|uniref:zinc finger CCCH domain-containing protein 65-like isoform X3 n=1 Tax=Magnolia sinica TaxID=86752 RepID=UPI0026590CDE|nr:zinc finger CCCH domain-containing protein 65-like isoform X3 [Magnolia sinica]
MGACEEEGIFFIKGEEPALGSPPPRDVDVGETLDGELQNQGLNDTENSEADPAPKVDDSKNGGRSHQYPLRPGEPDCTFYLRTGTCRYGSNCRFNHPPRRKNKVGKDKKKEKEIEKVKDKEEEKSGQLERKVGKDKAKANDKEEKDKEKTRSGPSDCKVGKDKEKEKENDKEKDKEKVRSGKPECKYYLKTGGCKFGKACRYSHPREKAGEGEQLELNFLGLPIRPGERECPFYMRTGSCKFATNCRFHHPDPTAVGGSDPLSGYHNDIAIPLHTSAAIQPPATLWSSHRAANEPISYMDASPPYVPMVPLPPQGVHSSPEWNGYQVPLVTPLLPPERNVQSPSTLVIPPERNVQPPSTSVVDNWTGNADNSTHQPNVTPEEFPERPGQPECHYFVRNGDCKFRSTCRYHHPKTGASKSSGFVLSPMGLPLRPDQTICTHYSRHGICKFGPACKFDHPINNGSSDSPASSATPALSGPPSVDNPVMALADRVPDCENGSDALIQQVLTPSVDKHVMCCGQSA